MKVFTEPEVYLIGRQSTSPTEIDRFLADHEVSHWETDAERGGEKLIEVAGRVCYMSFARPRPGGNKAYIDHIIEVGHGSVLEHAVWNFVFTGISRSLSHELVRHRAGMGYSQLSQRYVDESVCEVVVPEDLREEVEDALAWLDQNSGGDMLMRIESALHAVSAGEIPHPWKNGMVGLVWLRSVLRDNAAYRELTAYLSGKLSSVQVRCALCEGTGLAGGHWDPASDTIRGTMPCPNCGGDGQVTPKRDATDVRKQARQAARSVLPNATETKIFVTANARALRHFIELRASPHAEAEIRKLAYKVWEIMAKEAPHIFGDYEVKELPGGGRSLTTDHKKV